MCLLLGFAIIINSMLLILIEAMETRSQNNCASGSSEPPICNVKNPFESVEEITSVDDKICKREQSDVWQDFSEISVIEKGKVTQKWKCNYCVKSYLKQKIDTTY